MERRLVLEPSVEHRAAELVPAVRAHVALRVELREDRPLVSVLVRHGELQRGRAAGALEPDRLDVVHREPELVLQRDPDRLAATSGDVEVRRLAVRAVADREQVVGGEGAERGQRDRDPDDRTEHDVGEVVDAEVDPQHAGDRDRARHGELRPEPRPAGNDEHVGHADRQDRDRTDRDRRRGVSLPARELLHAERSRPQGDELEPLQEGSCDAEGDHPDQEVAPAAEPRGREHEEHAERGEPDAGTDGVRLSRERVEPPVRIEITASVIHASNRSSGPGSTRSHRQPVTTTATSKDQPDPARGTDLLGQRRGSAASADDVDGW